MSSDKKDAYETLYYVLVNTTKLLAPVAPIISEKIYQTLTSDGMLRAEHSVHLADWPSVPAGFENEKLLEEVELVQEVITLARSIRNKNRVKNRQPLNVLRVAMSNVDNIGVISSFGDVITEELNVKNIELISDVSKIAEIKIDPNFSEIRALYPNEIPLIIKAIKSRKYEIQEDSVLLEINGQLSKYDSRVLLVTYNAKAGEHVASKNGIVVSLDLTLTDELKKEGLARDIVRNIQDARKQLGCDIMDCIQVAFKGMEDMTWCDMICKETLADITDIDTPDVVLKISNDYFDEITVEIKK